MAITPRRRSSAVERGKLHAGAALLERVGDLQILVFDVDLGAGQRRQRRRRQYRRPQHMARDRAPAASIAASVTMTVFVRTAAPAANARPFSLFPPALQCQSRRQGCHGLFRSQIRTEFRTERDRHLRRHRPHAYDPIANPELFEGVLTRRVVAFVIDLVILALPVAAAAMFIFVFGLITFGLGWVLFWLLSPASVIWALFYYGTTLGSPASATLGMRAMEIEMRTWYGAPAYFVLGAVHADRLLDQRQRAHAVHSRGRLLQRPPAASARHPGRHRHHQQPGAGGGAARAREELVQRIWPLTRRHSRAI